MSEETFIIHGVGFNRKWVARMDLQKFIRHPSLNHIWANLHTRERLERLRMVHAECSPVEQPDYDVNHSGHAPEGEQTGPTEGSPSDHKGYESLDREDPAGTDVPGGELEGSEDIPG